MQRRLADRPVKGGGDGGGAAARRRDGRRRVRVGLVWPGASAGGNVLHDGDCGGGVVVDRVHGGEETVTAARAERVMAVAAAAAEGRRHWHVEQDVVKEGALDPAATGSTRGTTAAHFLGKLKRKMVYE